MKQVMKQVMPSARKPNHIKKNEQMAKQLHLKLY